MQVEPLFARQLFYYAQQGGHYYRGYEHHGVPEHISPSEDYQRATSHHHHHSGSMMQEWPWPCWILQMDKAAETFGCHGHEIPID